MNKETELLEEIYAEFINSNKFPDRDDFRNRHYQDLDTLDTLESKTTLQNRDGLYWIPIAELAKIKLWEHEKTITNRLLPILKQFRLENRGKDREISEILPFFRNMPRLKTQDIQRGLYYLHEACFLESYQKSPEGDFKTIRPREEVVRFKTIEERIKNIKELRKKNVFPAAPTPIPSIKTRGSNMNAGKDSWSEIQTEYDYSKLKFAKQISFASSFKRGIIIRDVAQAHSCLKQGFYKPAAILAGGVIEEILRLYLNHHKYPTKNRKFENYIDDCKQYQLVRTGIANLAHAFRDFRNFAHLGKENSKQRSISKTTANGAVNAIFTIVGNLTEPIPTERVEDKSTHKKSGKIYRFKIKNRS